MRNALDALAIKQKLTWASMGTAEGHNGNSFKKHLNGMQGMTQDIDFMVELSGIEPLTSSLRTRRSPS